jgi:hypothetical protein
MTRFFTAKYYVTIYLPINRRFAARFKQKFRKRCARHLWINLILPCQNVRVLSPRRRLSRLVDFIQRREIVDSAPSKISIMRLSRCLPSRQWPPVTMGQMIWPYRLRALLGQARAASTETGAAEALDAPDMAPRVGRRRRR